MRVLVILFCIVFLEIISFSQGYNLDSISENGGYTYISRPLGAGPFPGILYSHGGLGGNIGGDLRTTSIALAQEGYICWAQLRTDTIPITPHVAQVEASLDSLLGVNGVNSNKIGIIGFSRGGLLTLMIAISRPNEVHAVVAMAPAAANNTLSNTLTQIGAVNDSVLLMVAQNDVYQDDHVQLVLDTENAMNGIVDYRSILYDPYDADMNGVINNLDDGHELFWEVQEPYWSDLIFFLDNNLKTPAGINDEVYKNQLLIYPNPVDNQAIISMSDRSIIQSISIFHINGILFKEISLLHTDQFLFDKENLNTGIYLIKLTDSAGHVFWNKIIVD